MLVAILGFLGKNSVMRYTQHLLVAMSRYEVSLGYKLVVTSIAENCTRDLIILCSYSNKNVLILNSLQFRTFSLIPRRITFAIVSE